MKPRLLLLSIMKTMKHKNSVLRRSAKGFTLLEMVIVLGIIGLILGGAITMMKNFSDSASITRVKGDFSAITSALKMYKVNNGFYPSSAQGLKALLERPSSPPIPKAWVKAFDAMPMDPNSKEYIYKYPGSKNAADFEIIYLGKDGALGTEDDLSSQSL